MLQAQTKARSSKLPPPPESSTQMPSSLLISRHSSGGRGPSFQHPSLEGPFRRPPLGTRYASHMRAVDDNNDARFFPNQSVRHQGSLRGKAHSVVMLVTRTAAAISRRHASGYDPPFKGMSVNLCLDTGKSSLGSGVVK